MNDVMERSEDIRKWRNLSVLLFLCFAPVGGLGFLILHSLDISEIYALVIVVPYGLFFLYTGIRWSYASCPICHMAMFHKHFFFYGFFRCVNCGYDLKNPDTCKRIGPGV